MTRRDDTYARDVELFGAPVADGDDVKRRRGMTTGEALALAETWAARGIGVFPIEISWDDEKGHTNKAPLTEHGHKDASIEQRAVRLMFNNARPWRGGELGVGLSPGPAGYLFVDVDGDGCVERYAERDLPATFTVTTCSGARHYAYRKPEPVHVGTACDWNEVDLVRSDDGFVVAAGTFTPWGEWISHDDWATDVSDAPAELWAVTAHGGAVGTPGSSNGVAVRGLDAVLARLRADGRGQDAEALAVLCSERYGGHHPFMKGDAVYVTRPGKRAGTSASVGYVGPGVIKMFSSDWPDLANDHRYTVNGDRTLVDADDLERLVPSEASANETDTGHRRLTLTAASTIQPRPVKWLWQNRIALGTLALIGGREGIGKSILTYQRTADITRGLLPGIHVGAPRAVLVCATEDSWAHTIVPRLMAAGADLTRVYRIDVTTSEGVAGTLTLPTDLAALEAAVAEVDAAAIVLDPLLSRLSTALDTHKDAEVRIALEPLVALADRTGTAIIGLIHVNKATSVDPLTMLMASRAFAAVARAVLFVAVDPEDETGRRRYLGQPKNNLGTTDLPLLAFTIESTFVADTDEGEVRTGRVVWQGEDDRSIDEVLRTAAEPQGERTEVDECAGWLSDYLTIHAVVLSDTVKVAAKEYGHTVRTLHRARKRIGAGSTGHGFPRHTWWSRPGMDPDEVKAWLDQSEQPENAQSCHSPGETHQVGTTGTTGVRVPRSDAVVPVVPPLQVPTREGTTGVGLFG